MQIKNVQIHSTNYSKNTSTKKGVVLHWVVGRLPSATARFQSPNQLASAHYGIANNEVVRWVKDEEIAYHGGTNRSNIDYIGIEHEGGWIQNGERVKPSGMTHNTSAQLLANLSVKHGWGRLEYGKNVFKHSDIKATECCGSLDVQYIIDKANELINQANDKPNNNDMSDNEIKIMLTAITRQYNRGDIFNPNNGAWIDINHYLDLYKRTPEKDIVIDTLFQNIDDIKRNQGISKYNAKTRNWEV